MILLGMYDVDVILSMDWLSTHSALVDCFTKKIVFRKSGYLELEFEGHKRVLTTCVISILETKRLLHKGYKAYLAYVVDKSISEVTLDSVPIVREFLDVFFKNLPGLPPNRKLEFGTKLLSGSASISIPLYRMTLVKLKELKTQL